jgi:NitT/TauT family transport system substrate-binding protein
MSARARATYPSRCVAIIAIFLLLALSACDRADERAAPAAAPGLERVILQADWLAEPEHGGFYLARLRGYYREVGLDVEIRGTATPIDTYRMVAAGDVQFALGTSDNLIVAMSRGLPVVGVFPYFQRDPQGVMFRRGSGIRTLRDLDGKRVKISPGLHYVEYMQRTLGIRMQLVPMDGSTAQFVTDPDLVQQCFLTNEPWIVSQAGVEVDVLPFWDMALDPYRIVMTSRELATARPDLVRKFVAATLRGWKEYMAGDKADAFREIAALNPTMTPAFLDWAYGRMGSLSIVHGRTDVGETLGQVSIARLARQIGALDELDLLGRPVAPREVMFLDGYPDGLLIESAGVK